jgi:hypothetical protein
MRKFHRKNMTLSDNPLLSYVFSDESADFYRKMVLVSFWQITPSELETDKASPATQKSDLQKGRYR